MLSDSQLKFLADVLVTIGEVSLVSLVIPYFVSSELNPSQLLIGFFTIIVSWILGLVVVKNIT